MINFNGDGYGCGDRGGSELSQLASGLKAAPDSPPYDTVDACMLPHCLDTGSETMYSPIIFITLLKVSKFRRVMH